MSRNRLPFVAVLAFFLGLPDAGIAQCTNSSAAAAITAPTPGNTANRNMTAQRYVQVNTVVGGRQYRASSSRNNDYLTIRQGTYNGAVIAFGQQPLDWTAPANGTYFIHCNTNASCGTNGTNRTVSLYAYPVMTYQSSTTVQASTANASLCDPNDHQILRLQVVTTGIVNPLDVTEIVVRTNGSTDPLGDIDNIKVYYTGTSATFATGNLFGSAAPAAINTNIQVNGTQELASGTNYFWVVYDLKPTATPGNVVDAHCIRVVVDGTNRTPSQTNPAGNRTIRKCPGAPGGIDTGILLWIKPDAGVTTSGVNVTAWQDQSAAFTTTTVNGSPDLVPVGRNYNPVIQFTKSSGQGGDYITVPNMEVRSIFLAAQLTDLTRNCTHIATWDRVTYAEPCTGCALHGGRDVSGGPATYGEVGYGRSKFQSNGVWRRNGDPTGITYDTEHSGNFDLVTARGTGTGAVNRVLGGQVSRPGFDGRPRDWLGPVGELILYGSAVSVADANRVESYLAIKYGITLGGNGSTTLAYRSSNNTVIWSQNSGYHNDVIGIGRDDTSELLQKQSRTEDDSTRIFIGTLASSNQANTASFTNDREFVMIGHEGGKLCATLPILAEMPSGLYSRLEREWRVVNRGFTGTFSFSVKLNHCAIPSTLDPDDLRLLVDTDGDFSNAALHDASSGLAFTYSGGVITVSGISTALIPLNGQRYITIGSVSSTTPLPIELVAFDAVCNGRQVDVNWSTASERNNELFTIEAGRDGVHFEPVGEMAGAGNSTMMLHYAWTDHRPMNGISYYRLKQTDTDGTYTYSATVPVACAAAPDFTIFPNPARGSFSFHIPEGALDGDLEVEMYSSLGQLVRNRLVAPGATPGGMMEISLDGLPEGVYYVSFNSTSGRQTKKLSVIR